MLSPDGCRWRPAGKARWPSKTGLLVSPNMSCRWVADRTPYAIHQDNALISTSKGLAEWGKYLEELKIRVLH